MKYIHCIKKRSFLSLFASAQNILHLFTAIVDEDIFLVKINARSISRRIVINHILDLGQLNLIASPQHVKPVMQCNDAKMSAEVCH
jgi:hypothetical protein